MTREGGLSPVPDPTNDEVVEGAQGDLRRRVVSCWPTDQAPTRAGNAPQGRRNRVKKGWHWTSLGSAVTDSIQ